MKISVICRKNEWQVERLKEEARNLSVELESIDLHSADNLPDNLGEVVLWRSSSLGSGDERSKAMNTILRNHFLINRCLALLPQATEKDFQQTYVQEKTTSIECIPTFRFQNTEEITIALEKGVLHFPFIAKPNKGSKGEGVTLVHTHREITSLLIPIKDLVFQNYIKNSGDYRVFVLGGRVLGVIKRTAKKGGFLNNISQGGAAETVTDKKVLNSLRPIGTTIASIFELTLCGVDVIYDEEQEKFFFLEVNTVPQWKGFQEATGINVAREIILFCIRIAARQSQSTASLVQEEYESQIHLLASKKFHFLSRLFLWTGKESYRKLLDDLKKDYIGLEPQDHAAILKEVFTSPKEHGPKMAAKALRTEYFKKYPQLEPLLNLLFKNLFAQKLYGVRLRSLIQEIAADEDFLALKKDLEQDEDALRVLSTHAINYLYLLEFYLETPEKKVSPEQLFRIGSTYPHDTFELQIYFFTHCIIGATRFYSEKIHKNDIGLYHRMLKEVEKIIQNHFREISLDNKFEFLVCAKLCNFHSFIETQILEEADRSLSPDANFLIDKENSKAAIGERNDLLSSEHRNVLFIMSQIPLRSDLK